ncbi:SIR2 family protein [Poseidonocella sp. HB161398]|uniref:SIR2 family NAD-dependent protein deacylase n=1 Tax=Poseidonocella sp. HB161398 TaxID=2320855 RepID=UPI001108F69F|nr:SIR2 family protein [Poseidonocella sp. HB161398]
MSEMEILRKALAEVEAGTRIPYLGAGVSAMSNGDAPRSPEALCAVIEAQVRVPKRAQGNLWSAAQYVESRKFRATLADIVTRAFEGDEGGNPVHAWLARIRPPMVVDTWYDDGLLKAYEGDSWGWAQGWSRNGEWIEIWNKAFAPDGTELEAPNPAWASLIYKPHGMARKGSSFLLSDSDYVEVLTEIDIQTPIPEEVRARRTGRGFLFLGCRFDDQMLRIFARQIVKRSGGNHVAVIDGDLSRMEEKFLDELGILRVNLPASAVLEALASEPA